MADARRTNTFVRWNRKIHIFTGLYMLLFLWVFAVSGLLMNHPDWLAGQPHRRPTDHLVALPESGTNLEKAQDIMGQLGLRGEVVFKGAQKAGKFGFIALRPNERSFVSVDLATGNARLLSVTPRHPFFGTLNELHVFTGVSGIFRERESVRDWLPTMIWSFSMDALCAGLIVLVLSALYMGWLVEGRRAGVLLSFALGMAVFAYFMWGQVWLQ